MSPESPSIWQVAFRACLESESSWSIVAAAGALGASVLTYARGRVRLAIVLLALAVGALQFFMARTDPFLFTWDEQFHALVAKNLAAHPLRPTLYERPLLPYDYRDWGRNHVWLHKPPLALWQMAASIAAFGPTALAIRLPSVLLVALATILVFRIGTLAVDARAGYLAALLFGFAPTSFLLISGGQATDHVDVAFLFYVTATFWAWLEHDRRRTARWAVAVGLFAGLAVLTKYLVGLTVFAGWLAAIAADPERRTRRELAHLGLAAVVAVAVFAPWEAYTYAAYPAEYRFEHEFAHRHFSEVMEGRGGDAAFHLRLLPSAFGQYAAYAVPLALAALFIALRRWDRRAAMFSWLLAVWGFFALASTKMPMFTNVVSPIVWIALGTLMATLVSHGGRLVRPWLAEAGGIALTLLLAISATGFDLLMLTHSKYNNPWIARSTAARTYEWLRSTGATVVFNLPGWEHVPAMFYSGAVAYGGVPSQEQVANLTARGERIAVFDDGTLPPYLVQDPGVIRLDYPWFWRGRWRTVFPELPQDNAVERASSTGAPSQ